MKTNIKEALIKTVPVMAGYIFLGSAFGILIQSHGFSIWIALFMSIFIYAGAMQFASIPLLLNPISLVQTFLLTLSINARHLFYGLSMIEPFKKVGKKKPYMIFSLTDESYGLLINNKSKPDLMFLIQILNQSYWIFGTVLGYLFGNLIPFSTEGIDFSMSALFIIIFMDKFFEKEYQPLFIGLFFSITSLIIFGPDYFIITSMIAIVTTLLVKGEQQ